MVRAALGAAAVGEALAGVTALASPRRAAERAGRPYSPAYHGVTQDFGFYNLGFAALFGAGAADPDAVELVVAVALGVYLAHGLTHVLRYRRLYYGGGTPISTRPQIVELRDGMQLLAAAAGLALLFITG